LRFYLPYLPNYNKRFDGDNNTHTNTNIIIIIMFAATTTTVSSSRLIIVAAREKRWRPTTTTALKSRAFRFSSRIVVPEQQLRGSEKRRAGGGMKSGRFCFFTVRAENDDSPKVYVPCGAFGGASSPERKAADVMHQLLTYTAAWVVIGQLESINCRLNVQTPDGESKEVNLDGQGEVNRVNNQHEFLLDFLEKNPIRNPEEWMAKLMKADQSLANRIMTARSGYAQLDFEWASVEKLAKRDIENGNKKLQTEMLESMMGGGSKIDSA
jgi:hypothetical protein